MFFIKLYQIFTPGFLRGKCLFKESCSNYVYRKTKEDGIIQGVKSFLFRFKNCRPNYYIINKGDEIILITVHNVAVEEKYIAEKIKTEYKNSRSL